MRGAKNTLKASKEEIEALRKSWMDRLNAERQTFLATLKRRIVEQVIDISDKVLKDLANENLDQQIIQVFLEKVSEKKGRLQSGKDLNREGLSCSPVWTAQWRENRSPGYP